jgi:hypothetical protein
MTKATNLAKISWERVALPPAGFATQQDTLLPVLIYGTAWKKERTSDLVYKALCAGFRAVDTAAQPKHYREDLVGAGIRRAIQEGVVRREDIYVSIIEISSTSQNLSRPFLILSRHESQDMNLKKLKS